jgi:hypothetical protein
MKKLIAVVAFWTMANSALAGPEPFTCTELGIFAHGITLARDRGQSAASAKRIIDEDQTFTNSDKLLFKKVIDSIHSSPNIGPTAMAAIAETECRKTGKRKR